MPAAIGKMRVSTPVRAGIRRNALGARRHIRPRSCGCYPWPDVWRVAAVFVAIPEGVGVGVRMHRLSRWGVMALLIGALPAPARASAGDTPPAAVEPVEDAAVRKVIADYGRAIETKDLELFKIVKPNLTQEEERRARTAFDTVKSQVVKITVNSVDVQGSDAVVRVSRRDTLNGSLVSSFPQTFRLARKAGGWAIQEIGK